MTVAELIAALQRFPSDAPVIVLWETYVEIELEERRIWRHKDGTVVINAEQDFRPPDAEDLWRE